MLEADKNARLFWIAKIMNSFEILVTPTELN